MILAGAVNRRRLVLLGCACAFAYNLPNLVFPFFEDTGLFAAVGHNMCRGLLPYRDLLDQKPPGVFFITAGTSFVLGDSPLASRAVELVCILIASAGVGAVAREFEARAEAIAIATCGALLSPLWLGLPDRGQVEVYEGVFVAWGFAVVARYVSRPSRGRAFVAGLLLGIGCWLKPQAAVFGVAAAAAMLVAPITATRRARLQDMAMLVGGAVAASVPFLTYLWSEGLLEPFARLMLVDNRAYLTRSLPLSTQLLGSLPHTPSGRIVTLLAELGFAVAFLGVRRGKPGGSQLAVASAWLIAALVHYVVGGFFFHYQRIVLFFPLAIFVALGLWFVARGAFHVAERSASQAVAQRTAAALIGLAALAAAAGWSYAGLWVRLGRVAIGYESMDAVYREMGHESNYFDYAAQRDLATYVRERTRPGDTVQVLGRAGVFYLDVSRLPASRYLVTSWPLDGRRQDADWHLANLLDSLKRTRPVYLIVRTKDGLPWFGLADSLTLLQQRPEALNFVLANYKLETILSDDFRVMRRASELPR